MIGCTIGLINNSFSKIVACFTLLIFLSYNAASGQSDKVVNEDTAATKQKDIVDILYENFKIRLRKESSSLNGNGPFVSTIPVVGYSLQSGLTGALVANTSFYADNSRNKFSNILASAYYSQYHQYWFICNTNIFFEKFKLHLFGDTRYCNVLSSCCLNCWALAFIVLSFLSILALFSL